MIKRIAILLIVASVTIFSCTNSKQKKEPEEKEEPKIENMVTEADKIVYGFHDSSVPPPYHRSYSIEVTENNLHLIIENYSDTLLTKDWTFTKEKFNEVKERLKNLKKDGEIDESEISDGGTSESIYLYKNGKKTFSCVDHHSTKNFSGADIDLSYLIPDLKALIKSTESKEE